MTRDLVTLNITPSISHSPRPLAAGPKREVSHSRGSYCMTGVKPFKSKNRDKIDLDATNLEKGSDTDFRATA